MNREILDRFNNTLRTKASFSCVYCGRVLKQYTASKDNDFRLTHKKCYNQRLKKDGWENWKRSQGGKPNGKTYFCLGREWKCYNYPEPLFTIMCAQINNVRLLQRTTDKKKKKEIKKKIKAFIEARQEVLNPVEEFDIADAAD